MIVGWFGGKICGLEAFMARVSNRLTAMMVQKLKEKGRYGA